METITYIQVQRLIKKLPETKLSLAYRLLLELIGKEVDTLSPQADFMRLSLDERRRILAQQAEQMKIHYEQTADERSKWQSGDFIDTYCSAGVSPAFEKQQAGRLRYKLIAPSATFRCRAKKHFALQTQH